MSIVTLKNKMDQYLTLIQYFEIVNNGVIYKDIDRSRNEAVAIIMVNKYIILCEEEKELLRVAIKDRWAIFRDKLEHNKNVDNYRESRKNNLLRKVKAIFRKNKSNIIHDRPVRKELSPGERNTISDIEAERRREEEVTELPPFF